MEKSEISRRVENTIKTILKINGEIASNANFIFDLGADSLQSFELVAALEEEFNIEMDQDQALKAQTVSEAVNCISSYVNK
jgi:acyl carrier protein